MTKVVLGINTKHSSDRVVCGDGYGCVIASSHRNQEGLTPVNGFQGREWASDRPLCKSSQNLIIAT
jgi:hypothetical protein